MAENLNERLSKIRFLLMDGDGVLTDGRLYFSETGEAIKAFDVRDGYGLTLWHNAGFRSAIISGRESIIVENRAKSLGVEFVYQGRGEKVSAFRELVAAAGILPGEIAFVADDTIDLPLFPRVGLSVAVGDAHPNVKASAHYVTKANGGRGAVREVIDMLLAIKSH